MSLGRVFDIQRFSIHDGPGIRTTVFLKGCPLRCYWCHNPEGLSAGPALSCILSRCMGCGACVTACPHGVHRLESGLHTLDRTRCMACGACVATCCGGALELVGKEIEAAAVLAVVLRDQPFYKASGGGMTLSGGEPMLQAAFAYELCEGARRQGIHCTVETCGVTEPASLARLAATVDLFLFDLKETDPQLHKEFTGFPLAPILANLRQLHDSGAAIILRLPLIPGMNDRSDHFKEVARLVRSLPKLQGVELIAYHPMGRSKLSRFGLNESESAKNAPVIDGSLRLPEWIAQFHELGIVVINNRPSVNGNI